MQGDIEAVAAKSPQGLTLLMEQVSGSEAYKQQYEELQARAMAAEEKVATAFTRKKAVANERKQKKEQKDEAERYVAKQKELLDLRTEHTLFQLHHMKIDREAALKESKRLQDAATKVLRDHETFEEQVEGLKRKQAGCAKERMLQEKKVKKLQGEKDKKSPPMVRAKEESVRLKAQRIYNAEHTSIAIENAAHSSRMLPHKFAAAEPTRAQLTRASLTPADPTHEPTHGACKRGEPTPCTSKTYLTQALQLDMHCSTELMHASLNPLQSPPMVRAKEESTRLTKRIRTGEKELSELEGKAEVVAEKTAKLASERDTLSTRKKASEDALQQAEAGLEALRSRSQSLRAQVAEARERASAAAQAAAAARRDHKARTTERAKIEDQLRRSSSEREFVTKKLEDVEARLQDARSDRKAAGREKKHKEALDALKRMYPSRREKKHKEALDALKRMYPSSECTGQSFVVIRINHEAMGRDQDSVFVDNERTARDAITYLKDQKVPSMTFVPLMTCKVKMINERLRSLRGTARLAVDMVQPIRPEMARAFQYAFGNTLVCDGVEEAQDLAFNRGERHKVVSKDGTLFNKAGYITGGSAGNLEERARRWDEKVVDDLKAQREELASRLRVFNDRMNDIADRLFKPFSERLGLSPGAATLYSIDFSGLKLPKSAKDREATLRELQEAINAAAADLEGRSPNLRAVEQYDTVKEKEKEMAFLDAFNHISNEIDVIYKELTRSSMHPLGEAQASPHMLVLAVLGNKSPAIQ
ncbi:hypothetical protein DUNSADRAFT_4949 [Dunaliella salina]|uniref:SMC hinge domain-containing protein n=1 Tax=Dunaliella salina TaxID=3046 RepID=A0ABQ7GQY5_DUNSA|nr:hypothetical protein DUNSADRAFT_4949 [Dunaliella salina]|eukprot:KAF5837024.1 hypothetical protein DUNSADRAFT_4949 [Dunaliella salina]